MAFGSKRGKHRGQSTAGDAKPADEPAQVRSKATAAEVDETDGSDVEGPFDIDDFDDPEEAKVARLDLGSVLVPVPENAQLQIELSQTGVPSSVWVMTPHGRFTIAAYAAPKSAGLWREVAKEVADALRKGNSKVSIESGPWGREVVGRGTATVRFIGADGYRWMVRCVVNGAPENMDALVKEARTALADTVVRRGDTPMPVRSPLAVKLPDAMAEQLRVAAASRQAAEEAAAPEGPQPAARRSAQGSAMQQLRTTMGG